MGKVKIISECSDLMTDLVMEYLVSMYCRVSRVNDDDYASIHLTIDERGNIDHIESTDDTVYWVRRGTENLVPRQAFVEYSSEPNVVNYLTRDSLKTSLFLEQYRKENGANSYGALRAESNNSKLKNLTLAVESGLKIPSTCISNQREPLLEFARRFDRVITKDINMPVKIKMKEGMLVSAGTQLVTLEELLSLDASCCPMLLQECVEKEYEIRVFVIGDKCYSMAIFSQNNEKTAIDFRSRSHEKSIRCTPFLIGEEMENKILYFMDKSKLDTGSIDLIYTPKGNYVFLEVNPMGQFHFVSENCNYNLEYHIAKKLSL